MITLFLRFREGTLELFILVADAAKVEVTVVATHVARVTTKIEAMARVVVTIKAMARVIEEIILLLWMPEEGESFS